MHTKKIHIIIQLMTTLTQDSISCAQKIIMENNIRLHAKVQKLKTKLSKLTNASVPDPESDQRISYLKSLSEAEIILSEKTNDYNKLITEHDQLKISLSEKTNEHDQLKTILSAKIIECNEYDLLKTTLSEKTNDYNKLIAEYNQLKISLSVKTNECDQLKTLLSAKITECNDYNRLKISLSEKTNECDLLKTLLSAKTIECNGMHAIAYEYDRLFNAR